jgi:hypothetical protein
MMRRIGVFLVLFLGSTILLLSAQGSGTMKQIIVIGHGLGLPVEVTVGHHEVSVIKDGTYHSFIVNDMSSFVFAQASSTQTLLLDKSISCGYLATIQDATDSPYYLQVSRPILSGVISFKKIDAEKAKQWLASSTEQQ